MEFVSLFVDKVLEYSLFPAARQVGYVISYENNVNELKEQAKRLLGVREALQHRVDAATRNGEEIESLVTDWLQKVTENASKAKILLDEDDKRHERNAEGIEDDIACNAEELLDEDDKHRKIVGGDIKWPSDISSKAKEFLDEEEEHRKNKKCSSIPFSNLCWRHQLSRKAKKLAQQIPNIIKENTFREVSHPKRPKSTETWSSSATNEEAFESRVAALNQIMKALADPNLRLIGVYGLGGVGKSTLVREVAVKVKEKSPDMEVVKVEIKENPKIEKIQQEIAELLGLELKQQSLVGRATSLRGRLEKEKNILVILDDIWEKLDLEEIGIIFGKENKNCKILMTSRNRNVLSKMDTQKNFWLKELTEEEGWELFKMKVGLNESSESKELLTIAREVVAKCKGLTIAIVTIAAALKGKEDRGEWKDVLRRLQNHDYDDINKLFLASYENLKDVRHQSMFVLPGVINSSATIDIFKYCCGLGLFSGMNKMDDMQNNLDICIRKLKDSCLLQDNKSSRSHFSIHDVVRETAILIASRDQQLFFRKNGKLDEEEWTKDDKLKNCKKVLLDFCDIEKFPEGSECSNLTFFYLRGKDRSLKLSHKFFKGMPALKVLVLINMTFEFLDSSVSYLCKLHTLCLDECVLEKIDGFGKLEHLKILSFSGVSISKLPQEIGKLTKLQLLDLSRFHWLEYIPPGVLSNLQMLEVLLIGGRSVNWAVADDEAAAAEADDDDDDDDHHHHHHHGDSGGDDAQQSRASLAEITDLKHLNTLEVCVRKENMLPKEQLLGSLKLQRYEICIGDPWRISGESETSRFLKLDLRKGIRSKSYFKSLLDGVEDLRVGRLAGLENVVPDIHEDGLSELKHLEVHQNHELQFIANLVGLEHITKGSFSKLKIVQVFYCRKMKSLFSFSLLKCLPQLNEIEVCECNVLEGILCYDRKVDDVLEFAGLHTLILQGVDALIGFYCEYKTSFEAQQKKTQLVDPPIVLFSNKVIFSNMETLRIRSADKLNKIWDWQDGASFQNLKTVNVSGCHKISKLLPVYVLENLEELEVSYCNSLEVIFDLEETRKEKAHVKSSHLRKLALDKLPKLKQVWNKDPQKILNFPNLSIIQVSVCHNLKYLFPVSIVKALNKKLQKLSIISCNELETIVGRKEGANTPLTIIFGQVTALHLEELPKLVRFYPGTYSIECPKF